MWERIHHHSLWLEQGDNLEKWESKGLTVPERRVLLTHWVAEAVAEIDAQQEYRFRLFEKTGTAINDDGRDRGRPHHP